MLSKKVKRTFVGIGCCFVGTIVFLGCYLFMNLQAKRVDISTVESFLNEDIVNLNIIDVRQDSLDITEIIFEAKHKNMKYAFYNYTQGEGEGEYKNISFGIYDEDDELWELRTYPYGTESDTYIAYVYGELFEPMKSVVIFQNMDGKRFIYRLEKTYEENKE